MRTSPIHLPLHLLPPALPIPPNKHNNNRTRKRDARQYREKPPIPNRPNQRLRKQRPREREDVAHKVIQRDARARLARDQLCEHRRHGPEKEHAADPEEEVRNHGRQPEDPVLRRPAVPEQRGGHEERGGPDVLAQAVFGVEDELAGGGDAAGAAGAASHYVVDPFAAEEGGEQVAYAIEHVEEADCQGLVRLGREGRGRTDDGAEVVWGAREGLLDADVEEVEAAECNGGVVDAERDGREAQVGDEGEGVDEDAAGDAGEFAGLERDALRGRYSGKGAAWFFLCCGRRRGADRGFGFGFGFCLDAANSVRLREGE